MISQKVTLIIYQMNWCINRNRSVCVCTHTYLLLLRAEVGESNSYDYKSFDIPLDIWQNKTTGMLWKSKWSLLVKLTYQFFEGGNHPLHLVLQVMCICRMEAFHSGAESFDPMTCGGQPYKRKEGSPFVLEFLLHTSQQ